jgi:hypothetical protein
LDVDAVSLDENVTARNQMVIRSDFDKITRRGIEPYHRTPPEIDKIAHRHLPRAEHDCYIHEYAIDCHFLPPTMSISMAAS